MKTRNGEKNIVSVRRRFSVRDDTFQWESAGHRIYVGDELEFLEMDQLPEKWFRRFPFYDGWRAAAVKKTVVL